ncbi:SPOR domain-containing protein [Paludibacterium purpuratum]|uniref:DedD protein n=1 Tax=Paludibacterium purpuratum TaxID=1144873 RepID=A0A4R7AYJ6_9NEIS|nr:SPOR domain-containing protein [Paludibacterium purpuratum]TDR73015.1 DedD protein [Paludibacterium purpuratum]
MAGLSAQEELLLLKKRARRRLVGAVVLVLIATVVLWKVLGRGAEQPMRPESVLVVGVASGAAQSAAPAAPVVSSAPKEASRPEATALPESLSTMSQPVAPDLKARAEGSAPQNAVPSHKSAGGEASAPAHKRAADASAAHAKPAHAKTPPAAAKPHKAVDPAAILEGRAEGGDAAPVAKPADGGGKFVIQLAALSDSAKADALKARLADLGVDARFSRVQTSKGAVTRVRVGPFASRAEANAVLKKLAHAGVSGIVVGQ